MSHCLAVNLFIYLLSSVEPGLLSGSANGPYGSGRALVSADSATDDECQLPVNTFGIAETAAEIAVDYFLKKLSTEDTSLRSVMNHIPSVHHPVCKRILTSLVNSVLYCNGCLLQLIIMA